MAEYLIRLLKDHYKVAVLSRGYKRSTKGYKEVTEDDAVTETGDEPLQFKRKFPDIMVAVCEKRVQGIERLREGNDLVILDDAFQHRAVKPGLSILLFDYTRLREPLLVLPAGNLREPFVNRKRADLIVVTKTPELLLDQERHNVLKQIRPFAHQKVVFSYLDYGNLTSLCGADQLRLSAVKPNTSIFLLTGIANPYPLVDKLKCISGKLVHHDYPDHHPFTTKNILKLVADFEASTSKDKIIITTEKDAQRLQLAAIQELLAKLPVYYLPVQAKIHSPDVKQFNNLIQIYVAGHLQYH